jgi:N-acetylmuramoyl-L-alanine amidase
MQTLIIFALKIAISSLVLLIYYTLFLRNKPFYRFNRLFLLLSLLAAILIPFCEFNLFKINAINSIIDKQTVVVAGDFKDELFLNQQVAQNAALPTSSLILYIYFAIVALLFVPFIVSLTKLLKLYYSTKKNRIDERDYVLLSSEKVTSPFSFFKIIFWPSSIDINAQAGNKIFRHELAHVLEGHTYDKLLASLLCILCWFNPFFWLLRKELYMLHEFSADGYALGKGNTGDFAAMLLTAIKPTSNYLNTNSFYYSPIKRRLNMLVKSKKSVLGYAASFIALPFLALVFMAFTESGKNNANAYNGKKIRVVIDAAHGGSDVGAASNTGVFEKDITLALFKKIEALNENSNIEIIATRNANTTVNVLDRVAAVNSKNVDLLISIHVDNVPAQSKENKTGLGIWIPKADNPNIDLSKQLGDIVYNTFKENYKIPVRTNLEQRKAGIAILDKTNCPAVLIEAGFLSNKIDREYLTSEEGETQFAKNILQVVERYAATIN